MRPLRDALGAALVVLTVSALGLTVTSYSATRAQAEAAKHELAQIARIAASRIDGDAHRDVTSSGRELDADYRRVVGPLVALAQSTDDVISIYTAVLRDDRIYYVLDTLTIHRPSGETNASAHLLEAYVGTDPDFRRALMTQAAAANERPQLEAEGALLSAYAPFNDARGRFVGVVGVDMQLKTFDERAARIAAVTMAASAGLMVLSLLAGMLVFRLRATAAVAAGRDHEAARDLAAARDAAEQSNRAKSTFVAMMSHELRTPLNAIVGYGELMGEELSQRGADHLVADVNRVVAAGRHLVDIITDILDFSRMEADRLTLTPAAVDVGAVLRDLEARIRPDADAKGLVLRIDLREDAGQAWVDPARLRQLLLNLARNAVKFTERGTVTLRVRGSASQPSRLIWCVHDTGVGIPADKHRLLFKPFSQVDASLTRTAGGTGLGLVISHRLVAAMGGRLTVRSRAGRGSTFRASIPRGRRPSVEAA